MGRNKKYIFLEARLLECNGLHSNHEYTIQSDTSYIGRNSENDIVLDNEKVSEHHAIISREQDCFILSDLDSENGLKVNGKRVTKQVLQSGDYIEIGNTTFQFTILSPSKSSRTPFLQSLRGITPFHVAIIVFCLFILIIIVLKLYYPDLLVTY